LKKNKRLVTDSGEIIILAAFIISFISICQNC
jgi:hypothetical protein